MWDGVVFFRWMKRVGSYTHVATHVACVLVG
jgi:hypothetical protein